MTRRGEALLAVLVATAVTVAAEWRTITTLTTSVRGDLGDPLYFAWQLAWVGRALTRDPGAITDSMWTTNAFQQAPDTLAYTDVVLGYAPLAWLTPPGQAGALAQLNLALILATLTATLGGYLLAQVMAQRARGAPARSAGARHVRGVRARGCGTARRPHQHRSPPAGSPIAATLGSPTATSWSLRSG